MIGRLHAFAFTRPAVRLADALARHFKVSLTFRSAGKEFDKLIDVYYIVLAHLIIVYRVLVRKKYLPGNSRTQSNYLLYLIHTTSEVKRRFFFL